MSGTTQVDPEAGASAGPAPSAGTGVVGAWGMGTSAPSPAPVMSGRTRDGLWLLGAALLAGVAGDALLRSVPWGINLTLWVVLLGALTLGLRRYARVGGPGTEWLPWALALALLAAWRDSPTLRMLDLLALGLVVGMAVYRAQGGSVVRGGVGAYLLGVARALGEPVIGAMVLAGHDVRWGEIPRGRWARHGAQAARGLLIALPVLLVFGGLLMAADAVFAGMLEGAFSLDVPLALSHLAVAGMLACAVAGTLRALFLSRGTEAPRVPQLRWGLGALEVGMVLGSLDLLFAAFVAVQVRWFFGGAEAVTLPGSTLSYAEYARRGFFELTTVSSLVLPLLLLVHWLLRPGDGRAQRLFGALAAGTVALLAVIMASALRRMWLYQAEYGLTELRIYTTAFMGWLAVVFAWFAVTVLRGQRDRFAFGALVSGLAAVGVLHAAGPDALVVRVNAARATSRVPFDVAYAARLGGDAVPALLAVLPSLSPAQRCAGAAAVLARWSPADEDWRSWSWGRSRAFRAVSAREKELRATCPEAAAARRGTRLVLPPDPDAPAVAGTASLPAVSVVAPTPAPSGTTVGRGSTESAAYALGARVTLVVERRVSQPTPPEYDRAVVLLVDGTPRARVPMALDTGGASRANLYRVDESTYLLRDAFASYTVRLSDHTVRADSARVPARGRFVGAFAVGSGQESWRFGSTSEQEEQATELKGGGAGAG